MTAPRAQIRRKLMTIILVTVGLALLLTSGAFLGYEIRSFRQSAVQQLSTLGRIIAANSTAALAFENPDDAREILNALRAEPHVVSAVLFDSVGRPFAAYPAGQPAGTATAVHAPAADGYRFERDRLVGYEPVLVNGSRRLGTLYLEEDLGALSARLWSYSRIALMVFGLALLAAYLLSRTLQQQISRPILALEQVALAVSERRDYSVRAPLISQDELGRLTDTFNHMLEQIERQNSALTESEGRNRAVVDSALDAVIAMDHEGRIIGFNPAAERMFGHQRDSVLGQVLADTLIPVEFRERHRRGLIRYLENGHQGSILGERIEVRALRSDGSTFPVELTIARMPGTGAPLFTGFLRDITARKEADDRIQAQLARHDLLNRITRGIGERMDLASICSVVISNLEDNLPIQFGAVCLYDRGLESLSVAGLGTASAALAERLGLTVGTVLPVEANGLRRPILGDLVYEPETGTVEAPLSRHLAENDLHSLVVAPLLLESQVFGVLIAARRAPAAFDSRDCEFIRQLSEHVALAAHQAQIHQALQQAYEDLRQSQQTVMQQERLRALGQMASGIAHDINNAISPVALYTQFLLEGEPGLSPRAREYLETIERSIDDVAATVARMREFYRRRDDAIALVPADLNGLVHQVLALTRAWRNDLPQQRGVVIELATELAPDLPPFPAAESEIREALTNLVFNAVDAMPEGGTLTIRSGRTPGAQTIWLEVSDTGIGMTEETRRHCLEPFYTTKGERGTGLGLAMVFGVMQRHAAEIAIDSAVGQGTTMRLIFPAAPAAELPDVTPVPQTRPDRMRLLVVDDDPLLLKSLRDTLEADGHRVVTAPGGQEGIDAFRDALSRREPFAAVITDLGMPRVTGRQVAEDVKHVSPRTPVIMLTGWGQRLTADGEIPPHVDRLLSKPPKLRELRTALLELTQDAVAPVSG